PCPSSVRLPHRARSPLGWHPGRAAYRPRPARYCGRCRPPAPPARWPYIAPTSTAGCGASSGGSACPPNLARSLVRRREGGRRLPASLPLAPPSPCSDVPGAHQPAPPQFLVQPTPEIAAVLDLHTLDVDVDATDAAVQRHHSLRPSLANEGQRWPSNDTATRHGRHPRRRHLE